MAHRVQPCGTSSSIACYGRTGGDALSTARRTQLLNDTLYQVGWFACVLGAAARRPWTGFAIAMALIGAHLALSEQRTIEVRLVVLATAVGVVIEMIQIAAGTYRFTSGTLLDALPPPWLLAMWAQFAATFRFSMRGVITRSVPAVLFGAAGGPLAFLAGEALGAVTLLPPRGYGLLRLSICWAIALAVFSVVVRRVSPEPGAYGVAAGRG
ncbi:MAG: DUF2878 domain-containing protein [Acidimicrobiia bacterium]